MLKGIYFSVTATADQSAASFEMEMSQTGFSAHYSQVILTNLWKMKYLSFEVSSPKTKTRASALQAQLEVHGLSCY